MYIFGFAGSWKQSDSNSVQNLSYWVWNIVGITYVKCWIIVLMSVRSNWYLFSNERMIPTSMQGSKTQFFDVKKGPSPPLTQMMLILYNNRTILKAWAFLASIESIIYGRRTRDHKLSWSHSISFRTSLEKKPTNHATSLQFMQSLLKSRTLSTRCPKKIY